MDGKGRCKDNIWIERFWQTIKKEYVYIAPTDAVQELQSGIGKFIKSYNINRPHQDLSGELPAHHGWTGNLFSEYFRDLSTNTITEYCRMPAELKRFDSYYIKPDSIQNWQIEYETQEIAGYSCHESHM